MILVTVELGNVTFSSFGLWSHTWSSWRPAQVGHWLANIDTIIWFREIQEEPFCFMERILVSILLAQVFWVLGGHHSLTFSELYSTAWEPQHSFQMLVMMKREVDQVFSSQSERCRTLMLSKSVDVMPLAYGAKNHRPKKHVNIFGFLQSSWSCVKVPCWRLFVNDDLQWGCWVTPDHFSKILQRKIWSWDECGVLINEINESKNGDPFACVCFLSINLINVKWECLISEPSDSPRYSDVA